MTGTEAFCPAYGVTGTAGTISLCPAHDGLFRRKQPFSIDRDKAGQNRDKAKCPDLQGGGLPGQPGHTPLRSVPLSRPDADGRNAYSVKGSHSHQWAAYRQMKQEIRKAYSGSENRKIFKLCRANRSRASARWADVVDAMLMTMTAATSIHMGSLPNHAAESSITAAKQQRKRQFSAGFGSSPPAPVRGGVEPRRISLRKNFHMDSDANDR